MFRPIFEVCHRFLDGEMGGPFGFRRVPGFAAGVGAGTLAQNAEFSAPLLTTIVLARGQGAATFVRASAANVFDQDGIARAVVAGEVRFRGARHVRNFSANTENLTAGGWGATNCSVVAGATDPNGGTTAFTVTATSASASLKRNGTAAGANNQMVSSIWIRRRTGVGQIGIINPDNSGALGSNITITNAWVRYCSAVLANGTGWAGVALGISGDAVDVWHPQSEEVQGQSNQAPGEYQSNGVLAAPFQGTNADGTQCYTTQNGNSVAANVVTEAVGAPISLGTLTGYQWDPTATNQAIQNRDLSNAAWTKTNITAARDQTGIDGGPSAASSIVATLANGTVTQAIVDAANVARRFSVYMKRITGAGQILLSLDNGTTTVDVSGLINGATYVRVGCGQTLANPTLMVKIVTNGDKVAVDFLQEEATSFDTSPILTAAAAVTRNVDQLSYVTANIANAAGTGYAEVTIFAAPAGADAGVIGDGGSGRESPSAVVSGGAFKASAFDNANNPQSSTTFAVGVTAKIAAVWQTGSLAVFLNGGGKTSTAYGGTINGGGVVAIGYRAAALPGCARNVLIAQRAASDQEIAAM